MKKLFRRCCHHQIVYEGVGVFLGVVRFVYLFRSQPRVITHTLLFQKRHLSGLLRFNSYRDGERQKTTLPQKVLIAFCLGEKYRIGDTVYLHDNGSYNRVEYIRVCERGVIS